MRDILILNRIWAQDNTSFGGNFVGLNMKLALFYNLDFTKVCIHLETHVLIS
jgi:hypothetical protein